MDRDQAILHAADFILCHPECYDFFCSEVPETETAEGCALAWIGFFLGMPKGTSYIDVAEEVHLPRDLASAIGLAYKDEFGMPWRDARRVAAWLRSQVL